MIGDFLYRLSAKDVQSLGLDIVRAKGENTQAAVAVDVDFVVPNDRIFIIQSATWIIEPGAAQSCNAITMYEGQNSGGAFANPNVSLFTSAQPRMDVIAGFPVATAYDIAQEFEYLMVPSRKVIRMRAFFNAGAANNKVTASINGYSIPRGNVAF